MTSVDDLADAVMEGLRDYAELAGTEIKKAVRKTATSVKKEISANAPNRSGRYAKSWASKKTKENAHTLEMTVHSKNRIPLHICWSMVMRKEMADVLRANRISLLPKKTAVNF